MRCADLICRVVYGVTHEELLELLELLDEHAEPVTYDLLALGLRLRDLGTDALTWAELAAVVHQSPSGSALDRARNPSHLWDLSHRQLLAAAADMLQVGNWQRGGGQGPQPTLISLPQGPETEGKPTAQHTPLPVEEIDRRLGWNLLAANKPDQTTT